MNDKYPTYKTPQEKARSLAFVRYGLVILLTGFILRELVIMNATPYPGWLFVVLFVSLCGLLIPVERWLGWTV
jgi:hypothetical protein